MGMFKRKGGGGYLNGVNGVIKSVTFDSKEFGEGDAAYHALSAEVKILQDGAEDEISQFLSAGFLHPDDGEAISDDGETLEGGAGVSEDSEFARLVKSAVEQGVPEADFPEENGVCTNYSALTNWRFTFAKEPNVEKQMAKGRKKLGIKKQGFAGKGGKTFTEEEIMLAGRRQDPNDKTKFYNEDRLIIGAVLGAADEAEQPKGKAKAKAEKTADKPAKATKGKKAEDVDYDAADALLIDILANAKNNTVPKSGLSSAVVRKAVEDDMDNDTRDGFRKLFADDEYLAREAGWTFDADDKTKPVALAKKKK